MFGSQHQERITVERTPFLGASLLLLPQAEMARPAPTVQTSASACNEQGRCDPAGDGSWRIVRDRACAIRDDAISCHQSRLVGRLPWNGGAAQAFIHPAAALGLARPVSQPPTPEDGREPAHSLPARRSWLQLHATPEP